MKHRWQVALALIMLLALVISCAPPSAPGGGGTAAAKGPIKIGLLIPTSGNGAASGKDEIDGWNLYWEQHGNKVAGREIQWQIEDEAGDPTIGVTKARLLVEQQGVKLLVGPMFANVALAVTDYVGSANVPLIPDYLDPKRIPLVLGVVGFNPSQPHHPLGDYAFDQNYKRVVTICPDYQNGYDICGGFVDAFTRRGGKITKQLWPPINTADFGPYLVQMQGPDVDAVFAMAPGADAPRFIRAWNDFGLKGKVPLLGGEILTDQSNIRALGPEVEGIVTAGHYAEGRKAKVSQDFAEAYLKKYNTLPSYYSATKFAAAEWLAQIIEQVKGDVENPTKFVEAAKTFKLADSALGPRELDQYGNPISEIYIRRVEKRPDGKYWNVPIKTYEKVAVYWTFSADEFMKQPPYSRTFQGPKAGAQ